jgi:hypothetical protein
MKNIYKVPFAALGSALLLCSCASTPMGPTVQVMPGPTVPFQIFQQNQEECKQYAQSQVAGQADQANKAALGAAVLGTALGAATGAATSWHGEDAGAGAALGATAGTAIGAAGSQGAQGSIQDQYNNAYMQCMYSKGNQVPGMTSAQAAPPPPPPMDATLTVAQAQQKLNSLGFPVGPADGQMGGRTHNALRHFQQTRGLPQTGQLDAPTIQALSQ